MQNKAPLSPRRRQVLITCFVVIASFLAALAGCQGLPRNVANCPITPTAPANSGIVPPATEPPPAALCGFPLTISSPADNVSVNSPVPVTALANPPDPLYTLRIYVDGLAVMYLPVGNVNQHIWVPNGLHTIEIVAEDTAGYIATATTHVNVVGQEAGLTNIQNTPSWLSCSAVIIGGATCASGLGVAQSSLATHQSSPSLDGSAAKFSLGGNTGYSNELYWNSLGGGNSVSHFIYDLWFYIDDGNAPQSLEFDVNQAFGGQRWTWGSQCDFNDSHKWNIWDPLHGQWMLTDVPCNHFPSNTWIHLVWTLERVGNQVHYISLNVADQTYNVDTYYTAEQNWYEEEIDVAFQMDGNYRQQPYSVWLDEVRLIAY